MDSDKSESGLIESAWRHIEKDRFSRAFFCLALEAIKQLTRIADASASVAKLLDGWDRNGTLDISSHGP